MDDRVLGDVPSEGSEASRRFGIYSAYSPDPKMHSISRIRLLFVLAIAIVVAFAVIFPMVQYASRSRNNLQSLPYPEIANISSSDESVARTHTHNCSTRVLAFGLDCTEPPPILVLSEAPGLRDETVSYDVKTLEESSNGVRYEEESTEIQMDFPDNIKEKSDRMGRSRWPSVSTPYPYYSLPKPTSVAADDRSGEDLTPEQTNIFAIPADMSNDDFSEHPRPRINFTPPPYAFTPFPNFTDSYAQLSPYKVPKNYTNFEDILKFLNSKERVNPTESSERVMTNRNNMMKVSGTYVMPVDRLRRPGEIIVSSSENNEEARPFFNGHAYVTDPFLKFRPANPSEINRLIPVKSGFDVGPRFRKPVSFVPSSSVPMDLYAPMPSENDYSTAGSHTVAIFHPPPSLPNQRPTTPPPQDKPLSVTLDIYPVTMESDQPDGVSISPSTPGRVRGRLDPKWRPKTTERPRWRPQAPRRPPIIGGAKPNDNHMIVHLNLFPNKKKQYTFPRRGRQESTTQSHQKTTFLPGGQFGARSDEETSLEDTSVEVENRGTTDSTSSTSLASSTTNLASSTSSFASSTTSLVSPSTSSASSSLESDELPEYAALSGFGIEEVYTSTPGVNRENNDAERRTGKTRDETTSGQNNGNKDDVRIREDKFENRFEEGTQEIREEAVIEDEGEEKKNEEGEDLVQEHAVTITLAPEYVTGAINRTVEKIA